MAMLRRLRRLPESPLPAPKAPAGAWQLGQDLRPEHRERLLGLGLAPAVLDRLDLRLVEAPLPRWWRAGGNSLYVGADVAFSPARRKDLLATRVSGALVVLGSFVEHAACIRLHGNDATVFVGANTRLPAMEVNCGGGSAIILSERVTVTHRGSLDARNGGLILAGADQLWASDVIVATDDMHRLQDAATGERINGFGGRIVLGEHIWLGRDVVVTGDVELAPDSVVGMRSLVRNKEFAAGSAIAGTPARQIRTGVTWTRQDQP